MSLTISNSLAVPQFAGAESSSAAPAQEPQAQASQPANTPAYTVQLTEAQQVYNLYNQGQSIPQIATSLSIPVETVNNYLGVSASQS